jgi:hypothetical protein
MKDKDKNKPLELPELHWRVLGAIPSGKEKSITISYLMERLGFSQSGRRKVNIIIRELIFDYGYPIGTSSEQDSKGIFLIEDERDLSLACHTLNSRAMSNLERHKQLIKNFNSRNQLGLDF